MSSSQHTLKTRERLLETAGRTFAEKGYDRTTAKEICERAHANPAAINYHFGGKDKLYAETLLEAHRRFVTLEQLKTELSAELPADEKLLRMLQLFLNNLFGGEPDSWHFRLIIREVANPSEFLNELLEREVKPKSTVLKGIVSELIGRPVDDPAVHRGAMNVLSMCMLPFQNRLVISKVFDRVDLSPDGVDALVEHIHHFALGGLARIAEDCRKAPAPRRPGVKAD